MLHYCMQIAKGVAAVLAANLQVQGSFLRLGYPGDTWYNERTLVPGFGTWFWSGKTGADGLLATSLVLFSSQRILAEVFYTSADMWTGGPSGFS